MKRKQNKGRYDSGRMLLFSIILVFAILGGVVFSVSQKISREMSASAIQNLSESLDLMKGTIEAVLMKEAEYQKLIAQEIASIEDPKEFVRSYNRNETMVKLSLIMKGETQGVSNVEEVFSEGQLDFSAGKSIEGMPLTQSYLNYMGAWAYTIKCPVMKDGKETASLYIEYIYDTLEKSLPNGFYDGRAMLYIMDAKSERFVLKPKGMGERSAGHLNLDDFYRANNIVEKDLQEEVAECINNGKHILFYHNVRGKEALNYMWAINGGTLYLIGYVPVDAIQREGRTVNQNILIVVAVMLIAFFICCLLYYLSQRQQIKIRREQEAEREIHNKQLAEALQAAQIASHSKTMFLSNMSHDIRTPMNAVIGFTTLLAKDAENPAKVREYTKKIMASGQHLLSLINDVLDVSKIESGKVVLNVQEFTLNDLVSSVDAIIRPMAKAKEQNFQVKVNGIKHERLLGDETRISQVLINLLSNAVKYTQEKGSIWLRMTGLKQYSSQFEHIRIEVEDNGYGMTPEYLETIFDAFTRAENSTTNKVQGTGLGMAITKNIIELMGGTIEVTSEIGKGSRFVAELEFRIPEGHSEKQFWESSQISRILSVDGDTEEGSSIQMLLIESGVLADTALNMQQALSMIQEALAQGEAYHAILIDWDALTQEGIQTVRKVREAVAQKVPLVFQASYEADGVGEALEIPNTGVLTKPFFVSAFQEKLKEMKEDLNTGGMKEPGQNENLEGLHFLAAEDNEINAEILKEILAMEGADCEVAENGQLVLERFSRSLPGEFDAILMDVQMPVMNGYDATRAIRALDREDAKNILIAAMTANAFAEDEKEALDAGMDVHLSKPVDTQLLKKVIRQQLAGKE